MRYERYDKLMYYCNNHISFFKIDSKKLINNSLYLLYKVNHKIKMTHHSIVLEIVIDNYDNLYQLTFDIEECDDYIKNNTRYFQQEYRYKDCKILLRFTNKHILEEISIEIFNYKKN